MRLKSKLPRSCAQVESLGGVDAGTMKFLKALGHSFIQALQFRTKTIFAQNGMQGLTWFFWVWLRWPFTIGMDWAGCHWSDVEVTPGKFVTYLMLRVVERLERVSKKSTACAKATILAGVVEPIVAFVCSIAGALWVSLEMSICHKQVSGVQWPVKMIVLSQ